MRLSSSGWSGFAPAAPAPEMVAEALETGLDRLGSVIKSIALSYVLKQ
jgi:hypothetical protein